MTRPRNTRAEMAVLESTTTGLIEALREDGQHGLAARIGACQATRLMRSSTGRGWGLCRCAACPSCQRWILWRWCRRGADKLEHADTVACSEVIVDLGQVAAAELHDAVRRFRADARNLRRRRAAEVGGRRWREVEVIGVVQVAAAEGDDASMRRVRIVAVCHHPEIERPEVQRVLRGRWGNASVTPLDSGRGVQGTLFDALAHLHGSQDVALWGALHAVRKGVRPLMLAMGPIRVRAVAEDVAEQDQVGAVGGYAFVL